MWTMESETGSNETVTLSDMPSTQVFLGIDSFERGVKVSLRGGEQVNGEKRERTRWVESSVRMVS